jgi:hypothetical protein
VRGQDVALFVKELLPPQTLFNVMNKAFLLGSRAPMLF